MKKLLIIVCLFLTSCGWYIYSLYTTPRIAIITDIDYCEMRNPIPKDKIETVIDHIVHTRSQALISLGDNISYRVGRCSDTAKTDLSHIIDILKQFPNQNIFVVGDHDISNKQESIDRWHDETEQERMYFDMLIDDIHIIVLDTILGGDPLAIPCKEDPECLRLRADHDATRGNPESPEALASEKPYKELRAQKKLTRNDKVRDKGRVGSTQMNWLRDILTSSEAQKFLILSDHPLFPFTSHRKSYHIDGQSEIEKILQQKKDSSNATIISVAGEAHVWHREHRDGIDYYIVDEHKNEDAWALLTWGRKPQLWRMEGDQKKDEVTKDFAYYRTLQGLPLTEE